MRTPQRRVEQEQADAQAGQHALDEVARLLHQAADLDRRCARIIELELTPDVDTAFRDLVAGTGLDRPTTLCA